MSAPPAPTTSSRKSSDSADGGAIPADVGVLRDSGNKVEITIRVAGMKRKGGFWDAVLTKFKKPSSPSRLLSNGQFTEWILTAHSLKFKLDVAREKKRKKGNANRVDTFVCDIRQFPTSVNPDSARFEVLVPASGQAFILLTLIKTSNLNVNWKEFLTSAGTLDASDV